MPIQNVVSKAVEDFRLQISERHHRCSRLLGPSWERSVLERKSEMEKAVQRATRSSRRLKRLRIRYDPSQLLAALMPPEFCQPISLALDLLFQPLAQLFDRHDGNAILRQTEMDFLALDLAADRCEFVFQLFDGLFRALDFGELRLDAL